jgi:hypothetical protein
MASSNYLKDKLYRHVLRGEAYPVPSELWLALFSTAPNDAGGGTEVGTRQPLTPSQWSVPNQGAGSYGQQVVFASMPATTVTAVAVFDAATGGNMLIWGLLANPKAVSAGDSFVVRPGDLRTVFR